jgi:CPA2 family monovalent cation:H+ antiporter-2
MLHLVLAQTGEAPVSHVPDILANLTVILSVAAVTTLIFQRLRQPVVLGYLLAGLIVGPHLPVPLLADVRLAHALSELGVILLMFSLGLEFSLRKLARVAATAGLVALIQCSLMMWLGYSFGRLLGWTGYESLFAGAALAISSTTIIVKAFADQNIKGRITEIVFGILIVEDLIAVLLLAILTTVATGNGVSAEQLGRTTARLAGFLVALVAVGLFTVPRLMRFVVRQGRAETTVIASVGVCFAFALLARQFGYSVALGAFLGGALVAESGESPTIEPLLHPVRDMFAAIFFVAVGMLIDPALVAQHWVAVLVLTVVVVVGKLIGVTIGAFLTGSGVRTSIQAGMSMAQIGEFSFIIAGVGMSLGVVGDFLYPVTVAVSGLTTLLTPWLVRAASPVALYVDRHLPHPLQTYASLYGSWVQQLRAAPPRSGEGRRLRRWAALLLGDAAIIACIVAGTASAMPALRQFAHGRLGISPTLAQGAVVMAAVLLIGPFVLGAVRLSRALGAELALQALPASVPGRLDLAAAPRKALVVTLQLATLVCVGIPLTLVIQSFVPFLPMAGVLATAVVLLVVPFWKTATNLEQHVRAGAQVIGEALAAQTVSSPDHERTTLAQMQALVPGLGELQVIHLEAADPAIGQTLKHLNLRGLSGATAVALQRKDSPTTVPTGDEQLAVGDSLVVAGTSEAVKAATSLLKADPGSARAEGDPGTKKDLRIDAVEM